MTDLRTALKQATADRHHQLDQQLPVMEERFSLTDYQRLLEAFYSFLAPLESVLAEIIRGDDWESEFAARTKLPALERDLREFGHTSATLKQLPKHTSPHATRSLADFLGASYVIEGSTLGGMVLARHVAGRWGLTPDSGSAYFQVYGTQTGHRWNSFCVWLNSHQGDVPQARVVEAALLTFTELEHWFRVRQVIRSVKAEQLP